MPGAGRRSPHDAHAVARFSITIDGAEIAQFSELVELTSVIDPSELPGLGDPRAIKRDEDRRPHVTVVLRRGPSQALSR